MTLQAEREQYLAIIGARVRVRVQGNKWRYGVRCGPEPRCESNQNPSMFEVWFDGDIGRSEVPNDENFEQVMSPSQWSRKVFPEYCRDIAHSKVKYVNPAMGIPWNIEEKDSYMLNNFCLDDKNVLAFAEALKRSTVVETVDLKQWGISDLSMQGTTILSETLASLPTLTHVKLVNALSETASGQQRLDILCRHLGTSQSLRTMTFECCFHPSIDAFKELCKSRITELRIGSCIPNQIPSQQLLETQLVRLAHLRSVDLCLCQASVVASCLLGLVDHHAVTDLSITNTHTSFSLLKEQQRGDLILALERLMESRAQRGSLIRLCWGENDLVDCETLCTIAERYDALESLTFSHYERLRSTGTSEKLGSLLMSTRNLRKLVMPKLLNFRGKIDIRAEDLAKILHGVRLNRSLRELSIATECPDKVLEALEGNKTLPKLTLWDSNNISDKPCDFSRLQYLEGLHVLDIEDFEQSRIDLPSLIAGLKKNTGIETIKWFRYAPLDQENQMKSHLQLNRFCNQFLLNYETFAHGMWRRVLGEASGNVDALHRLVRGNPGIFKGRKSEADA